MIVIAWQGHERLALGMGFGKIGKVNWNIPVLYRNASSYHLIDVVTLADTRRGHMVFRTKLTDRGSSNLSLNDMHWFNMTESYKYYTTTLHLSLAGIILCVSQSHISTQAGHWFLVDNTVLIITGAIGDLTMNTFSYGELCCAYVWYLCQNVGSGGTACRDSLCVSVYWTAWQRPHTLHTSAKIICRHVTLPNAPPISSCERILLHTHTCYPFAVRKSLFL